MKLLTPELLKNIAPDAASLKCKIYAPLIVTNAPKFGIITRVRMACFLSQVLEESGQLQYVKELWGPTTAQAKYEPPHDKAKELGNTEKGDGYRFRGRGLIQITGRSNYMHTSSLIFGDPNKLIEHPEILEQPENALLSALHYWETHNLNDIADKVISDIDTLKILTRKVNGGLTHYEKRLQYYKNTFKFLS